MCLQRIDKNFRNKTGPLLSTSSSPNRFPPKQSNGTPVSPALRGRPNRHGFYRLILPFNLFYITWLLQNLETFNSVKTFAAPAPNDSDNLVDPRSLLSVAGAGTSPWQDLRRLLRRVGYQLRWLQHCGFAKEWC